MKHAEGPEKRCIAGCAHRYEIVEQEHIVILRNVKQTLEEVFVNKNRGI
jgi:hypothetical protein